MPFKIAVRKTSGIFLTVASLLGGAAAKADSSSAHLAAYYERKMVVCDGRAYQWQGVDKPKPVASNVAQIGVGRDASYVLTRNGKLMGWDKTPDTGLQLLDQVRWFAAGRSGVFAIRSDDTLWYIARSKSWFGPGKVVEPVKTADDVAAASIGDSADYYITRTGVLYVGGLAHRGQYGDGKLRPSGNFIPVAQNVTSIKAHTGHAIHLTGDGVVMGTGGNIYGPLGRHGLGDKAIVWGEIFKGAASIATGSSHSAAIRPDRSLWMWGRGIGLDPVKVLENVVAVAADTRQTVALDEDATVWQWDRDQMPKPFFRCPQ